VHHCRSPRQPHQLSYAFVSLCICCLQRSALQSEYCRPARSRQSKKLPAPGCYTARHIPLISACIPAFAGHGPVAASLLLRPRLLLQHTAINLNLNISLRLPLLGLSLILLGTHRTVQAQAIYSSTCGRSPSHSCDRSLIRSLLRLILSRCLTSLSFPKLASTVLADFVTFAPWTPSTRPPV
jgi:hypothetical protein